MRQERLFDFRFATRFASWRSLIAIQDRPLQPLTHPSGLVFSCILPGSRAAPTANLGFCLGTPRLLWRKPRAEMNPRQGFPLGPARRK